MGAKVLKYPGPKDIKIIVSLEEKSLENIEKNIDKFIDQSNINREKTEDLKHTKIPIRSNKRLILIIYPINITAKDREVLIRNIKILPGVLDVNTENIELVSGYQKEVGR